MYDDDDDGCGRRSWYRVDPPTAWKAAAVVRLLVLTAAAAWPGPGVELLRCGSLLGVVVGVAVGDVCVTSIVVRRKATAAPTDGRYG